MKINKGIILTGGAGTRLYPATAVVNKQLLSVYGKPMIYYPLSTLMMLGVRDILVVSDPRSVDLFFDLLGSGSRYGVKFSYAVQDEPKGIAHAVGLAKEFISDSPFILILGDNIFYGKMDAMYKAVREFKSGATVFGYPVKDPERYGVLKFGDDGRVLDIAEKPTVPPSKYAVPGLYIYDSRAPYMVDELSPSNRGELEITDLNRLYMRKDELNVELLGRGMAWLDTGTPEALLDAETFIAAIETRQGMMVGCPEEVAIRMGYIDCSGLLIRDRIDNTIPNGPYKEYVLKVLDEVKYRR